MSRWTGSLVAVGLVLTVSAAVVVGPALFSRDVPGGTPRPGVEAAASSATSVPPTTSSSNSHPGVTQYDPQATETVLVGEQPTNWNPLVAAASSAPSADVLREILAPVLPSVFDAEAGYRIALDTRLVLSAVQTGSDPQRIVYQINPLATWSDGTPITYQDFAYAWQSQSGSVTSTNTGGAAFLPSTTEGYRQIASVTEVGGDPYRVAVVFAIPYPDWRSLFSPLIPAHVAAVIGFDSGFVDPVSETSGGPFEIQSWTPDVSVTLVRNPRYWGPPARLAQITFRFATGQNELVASLAQGVVDAAVTTPTAVAVAALGGVKGLDISVVSGSRREELDLNASVPVLSDVRLRRAVIDAVDRPKLLSAAIGSLDRRMQLPDSIVFAPGEDGYRNDAPAVLGERPVEIINALRAAGYTYDGTILDHGGEAVSLTLRVDPANPAETTIGPLVAAALGRIGIAVSIVGSGSTDLSLTSSTMSPFASVQADRFSTFATPAAVPESTGGVAAVSDPDPSTPALIARADATAPGAARLADYGAVDRRLWADAIDLPLYAVPVMVVNDKRYLNMVNEPAPLGPTSDSAAWGVAATP